MKKLEKLIYALNLDKVLNNPALADGLHGYAIYQDASYAAGALPLYEETFKQLLADNGFNPEGLSQQGLINLAATENLFSILDLANKKSREILLERYPGLDLEKYYDEIKLDRIPIIAPKNTSLGGSVAPKATSGLVPISDFQELDPELDDSKFKRKEMGKKIGVGALLAGVAVGGAYGGYTLAKYLIDKLAKNGEKKVVDTNINIDDEIDYEKHSVKDLIYKLENEDQKDMLLRVNQAYNNMRDLTRQDDNFRLEEDANAYLTFNHDELIALDLMLNDYSKILGDRYPEFIAGFDYSETELRANFQNAWYKYSVYLMNGKLPSTFSELIIDSENRNFFIEMEDSVLKFNTAPSQEAATEVWKEVYYKYLVGGSIGSYQNSLSNQTSARANVAFFSYAGAHAMSMANRNIPEYFVVSLNNEIEKERVQLGEAYLENGTQFLPLLDGITEEFATVIENEDTNKDYDFASRGETSIDEAANARGLCEDVYLNISHVASDMREFKNNELIQATNQKANAKNQLVTQLSILNEHQIAEQVRTSSDLTNEFLNSISTDRDISAAINEYKASIAIFERENVTIGNVLKAATLAAINDETINLPASILNDLQYRENDMTEAEALVNLTNNRFRNMTKDFDLTENQTKENVVTNVVSQKTTEVQVEKNELPKDLQEEASKQENQIVGEIAKDNTPSQASIDATDYANSTRYQLKSGSTLDKYNLGAGSGLTYYNTQRHLAAFDGKMINVRGEQQIQEAAVNDFNSYIDSLSSKEVDGLKQIYGSNWKDSVKGVYNSAWMDELSAITSQAYNDGIVNKDEIVKSVTGAFEKAQEEVDQLNKEAEESKVTTPDKAPTVDSEAPKEVPKETVTEEEITPGNEKTDPNIGEQFEEGEELVEEIVPNPEPTTKQSESFEDSSIPTVINEDATLEEQRGQTPSQGGQALTQDDEAEIQRLLDLQKQMEKAEEQEINSPAATQESGPTVIKPGFSERLTEEQVTASDPVYTPPVTSTPESIENDDLNFIEEEIEMSEPGRTK